MGKELNILVIDDLAGLDELVLPEEVTLWTSSYPFELEKWFEQNRENRKGRAVRQGLNRPAG